MGDRDSDKEEREMNGRYIEKEYKRRKRPKMKR